MSEQLKKIPCCTSLLAHVNASRRVPHNSSPVPCAKIKKLGGIRKVSTCPNCKETAIMGAFHHYGIYKA